MTGKMLSYEELIIMFFGAASSSEIRDILMDESLQKLICNIDCSADPESELDKAMGVDAFCIFTDKLAAEQRAMGKASISVLQAGPEAKIYIS
ncbi:unnamed protein product [Dovyalis caffra]|uniref:Uncharacterized protein n=1 Tax=Dovyalis caffra TaxID=77055 RepID=A0AAV1SGS4_9ROSI|nr:unnamed protein product [Dovyalis caffra]